MKARIKEGWYPYGVGFVVEVEWNINEPYCIYQVKEVISGNRKNYNLCTKKLLGKYIPIYLLDFNYNNMQDTIKTFKVKIKNNHPNPSLRGLKVDVILEERLQIGDRYKIVDVENCSNTPYDNYFIMDEYLDFELTTCDGEIESKNETDYLLSIKTNSERPEINEENTRVYNSGAQRDGDGNKPYTHDLKPYLRLRFGYHMRMGARKYGDGNFLKGFPDESIIQSGDRHWTNIMNGDLSEDNCSAMIFAIQLLMLNQEKVGIKPDHWFKKLE